MGFSPDSNDGPIAAINVTPLVDVMLVLLVIFMVTAPMLQQGVDVNLPKVSTGAMSGKNEQIVLSVNSTGQIYIGKDNEVQLENLAAKVQAVFDTRPPEDRKIYIKADKAIDYGRVMQVIGALTKGGITQVGLVSAPEETVVKK